MDLNTVTSYRFARSRADLTLAPGEKVVGGGTWLFSEPQPRVTGLVDLTTLDWPDLEVGPAGLRIAATCTIAALVAFAQGRHRVPLPQDWAAASVIPDAANALLSSFKVWSTATVGGNICQAFCAGSMISLAAALDGEAVIWTADGGEHRRSVASIPVGNGVNGLAADEVLRAIEIPARALRSRLILRKIALAELGRSGAVVTGRMDEDAATVFTVTGATLTPTVLRFAGMPGGDELDAGVADAAGYYSDPLGAADWRRGVSRVLAARIRAELEEAA